MKVCLVEDDRELCETLLVVLERSGYEARGAANGRDAVSLLRSWQPDVVVCDMVMPESEGFEVLRTARAVVPDATFVMMSGASGEMLDMLDNALLLGASHVLRKPFAPSELLDVIASSTE